MSKGDHKNIIMKVVDFYIEGFRSMTLGRTLWAIIIIKLFIMFAILRLFFFPNFLNSQCDNDSEKSEYVREKLIRDF